MHSDDLHFRICLLDGAGNAADQAAAADGHDHRFNLGMLLQHLETESSLAGDDRVIVERVDESEMLLLAAANGFFAGLVVIGAVENDFRAVGLGGRHLNQRSGEGHANLGADAALAGVIGQSLCVISSRGRNHSLIALFRAQSQQLVQRAALLECASSSADCRVSDRWSFRSVAKKSRRECTVKDRWIGECARVRLGRRRE